MQTMPLCVCVYRAVVAKDQPAVFRWRALALFGARLGGSGRNTAKCEPRTKFDSLFGAKSFEAFGLELDDFQTHVCRNARTASDCFLAIGKMLNQIPHSSLRRFTCHRKYRGLYRFVTTKFLIRLRVVIGFHIIVQVITKIVYDKILR